MNRRHTAADYLALVGRIRAARPDIALSGDFIVGFPGEGEADFADTLALVEAVGYAQAFSFAYSPRPGTPAAGREQVEGAVKAERLARLQALLARQQAAHLAGLVGRTLPVLVEKPGRRPGQVAGRSPYLNPVHLEAEAASDRAGGGGAHRHGRSEFAQRRSGGLTPPANSSQFQLSAANNASS